MTYLKQLHYFKCYIRWHLYWGVAVVAVQKREKKADWEPTHRRKGTSASQVTWDPTHLTSVTIRVRSDDTHRHEAAAILSFLDQKSQQNLAVPLDLQLLLESRYLEVSVNEDFEFSSWQVWGLTRSMFRVATKAQESLFLLIYLPPLLCFQMPLMDQVVSTCSSTKK